MDTERDCFDFCVASSRRPREALADDEARAWLSSEPDDEDPDCGATMSIRLEAGRKRRERACRDRLADEKAVSQIVSGNEPQLRGKR